MEDAVASKVICEPIKQNFFFELKVFGEKKPQIHLVFEHLNSYFSML